MRFLFLTFALVLSIAGGISVMESDRRSSGDDNEPNACVSLFVHPDGRCKDGPIKTISFSTWTEPGSPCYTNDKMIVSVKDQYCSKETGNWHQTIYPKDGDCDNVPWWLSWLFPQEQVFVTDGCIIGLDERGAVGLSLKSCQEGPCDGEILDYDHALFASARI
jgi:hypothetical protein